MQRNGARRRVAASPHLKEPVEVVQASGQDAIQTAIWSPFSSSSCALKPSKSSSSVSELNSLRTSSLTSVSLLSLSQSHLRLIIFNLKAASFLRLFSMLRARTKDRFTIIYWKCVWFIVQFHWTAVNYSLILLVQCYEAKCFWRHEKKKEKSERRK